jgi:DNA-directed RNA polymerase subunit K/omega
MPPKKAVAKKVSKAVPKKVDTPKQSFASSVEESDEVAFEDVRTAQKRKTTNQMSEHEYCSLIAARVLQLGTPGASPMLRVKGLDGQESFDTNVIATEEVRAGLVKLIIRRTFQDGTYEDWQPSEMVLPRIGTFYRR